MRQEKTAGITRESSADNKGKKKGKKKGNHDEDDEDEEAGIQLGMINKGNFKMAPKADSDMHVQYVAGTIALADKVRFERMLYRVTRANVYLKMSNFSLKAKDIKGEHIKKVAFLIFFKSQTIEAKILKVCNGFSANKYDLGDFRDIVGLEKLIKVNDLEVDQLKLIVNQNTNSRRDICLQVAECAAEWLWVVRREKAAYHTLNLFKSDIAGPSVLRGKGWILTSQVGKARSAIKRAHVQLHIDNISTFIEKAKGTWPTPPTHFQTNKYTVAFQQFVNTYGTPRYKEANPALFTAATFPFLFGVMYGDMGHGSCLALAGLYLILTEHKAEARETQGMLRDIYVARYMLFAMGLMGVYAGMIYNDYFSIGLNMFGSKYTFESKEDGAKAVQEYKYGDENNVYPFGVDPVWKLSTNELLFYNSMKMKMSVILGIFQMTFGVILRGMNAVYFRSWLDFFTEFLPMIIFDLGLFGYMVILIFVKWSIDWNQRMALGTCSYDIRGNLGACSLDTSPNCYNAAGAICTPKSLLTEVCTLKYGGTGGGCQPPNLITTLINIALAPGSVDQPMYAGQGSIQTILLLVAFLCIPVLLFVKPLVLRYQHNASKKHSITEHSSEEVHNPMIEDDDHIVDPHAGGGHGHGGDFNFGEIFIHQAIETIEFVLGMVSNTASYLRLWALSLAHTELAMVFWEKAMISGITTYNPVAIVIAYAIFAMVTFAVLLAMDVLECFLHALRLHWVEFQNKFYRADGYAFVPFDYKEILEGTKLE